VNKSDPQDGRRRQVCAGINVGAAFRFGEEDDRTVVSLSNESNSVENVSSRIGTYF